MKKTLVSACALLALCAPVVFADATTKTKGAAAAELSTGSWEGQIEKLVFDQMNDSGSLTGAKQVTRLRTADGLYTLKGFESAARSARIAGDQLTLKATTPGQVTEVSGRLLEDGTIAVEAVSFGPAVAASDERNIVSRPITIILSVEEENDTNVEKLTNTMKQVTETFKTTSFNHKKVNLDANGDGKPDVYGTIKVKGNPDGCSQDAWSKEADEIIKEKYDVDWSLYNHRIYIFDKRYSCGWAGLAYLGCIREQGGGRCPVWMNTHAAGVILHEIGHNLGFHHAMKGNQEYGDHSDPMGSGWETFFNVAHTDQLGWFDGFEGAVLDIESLEGKNTTVEIHPITADNDGKLKAIRYNYKKIPFSSNKDTYYFGLRTGEGLDEKIGKAHGRTKYLDHLNVHTIFSQSGGGKTSFKKSIGDGESWRHPGGAFTLTQQPVEASKSKKILIEFNK